MKIHAYRSLVRNGVELVMFPNPHQVVQSVTLSTVPYERGQLVEPSMLFTFDEAQQLIQELWDQGFRPNNGAGSSAEAEAMKKHITFAESVANRLMSVPTLFTPKVDVLRADERVEIKFT